MKATLFAGFVSSIAVLVTACAPFNPQTYIDADKKWLKNEFQVPEGAELLRFDSDSVRATDYRIQREGLYISGTFKLSPADLETYRKTIESDKRWQRLPLPENLSRFIRKRSSMQDLLTIQNGFYRAETAGDNILNAPIRKTYPETGEPNDRIIGILDLDKAELHGYASSSY